MKVFFLLLAILPLSAFSYQSGALEQSYNIPTSFNTAKNKLYRDVYSNSGKTFYAKCDWSDRKVNLSSCGLQDRFDKGNAKRARRTEAEHVIPASWLLKKNGVFRQCYYDAKKVGESPRDYCQENDVEYNAAHNDLFNLVPSVGAINGFRSNKPFSESLSGGNIREFRGNFITSRVIVPAGDIRGDIARIALYMEQMHGASFSERQKSLFIRWMKDDPMSEEEKRILKKKSEIQNIPLR